MAAIDAQRARHCPFCTMPAGRIIAINELAYAIRDLYPDTSLHTLIIPKRHIADYFDLGQAERHAIHSLMEAERDNIRSTDKAVLAFNVAINCGKDAGQTILHCHIHLIPRRRADNADPGRSVLGIVPNEHPNAD